MAIAGIKSTAVRMLRGTGMRMSTTLNCFVSSIFTVRIGDQLQARPEGHSSGEWGKNFVRSLSATHAGALGPISRLLFCRFWRFSAASAPLLLLVSHGARPVAAAHLIIGHAHGLVLLRSVARLMTFLCCARCFGFACRRLPL